MINYTFSPDSTESANRKLLNGQTLLIANHPDWFAIYGNTYGGDGITTFALPNVQNRLFTTAGDLYTAGNFYGNPSVVLTVANLPQHSHDVSNVTVKIRCNGNLTDSNTPTDFYLGANNSTANFAETFENGAYMADPVVSGSTDNTGGSHAFSIIPPVFAVYAFIETI